MKNKILINLIPVFSSLLFIMINSTIPPVQGYSFINPSVFLIFISGLPYIIKLSFVDFVFMPILLSPNSIVFILSDSLCLSSLIPENLDLPLIIAAIANNNGNSSIALGTSFFEQLIVIGTLAFVLGVFAPAFANFQQIEPLLLVDQVFIGLCRTFLLVGCGIWMFRRPIK